MKLFGLKELIEFIMSYKLSANILHSWEFLQSEKILSNHFQMLKKTLLTNIINDEVGIMGCFIC